MRSSKPRVLFMAEAVTLAHVVRPLELARALSPERFDLHFACAPAGDAFLRDTGFTRWPIRSLDPPEFLRRLATGEALTDEPSLEAAVEEDLALFDQIRPDLVVGDFRLSLGVSAALAKVPHAALTNGYWSPYSARSRFPIPDHPLVDRLGPGLAGMLFGLAQPIVFHLHGRPLNAVRRRHGLTPLGDMRDVYTHGDFTLYLGTPLLEPTVRAPEHHRYLGPVLWSPEVRLPASWEEGPVQLPLVYVTLGSSGSAGVLPPLLEALRSLPVRVALATAGRPTPCALPENVQAADYLPGTLMARRASLVVCNGGSPTSYQALAEGTPVLGIASNMDQYLAMSSIARLGAGLLVRAGRVSAAELGLSVARILQAPSFRARAREIAEDFRRYDARRRFAHFVEEVLGNGGSP